MSSRRLSVGIAVWLVMAAAAAAAPMKALIVDGQNAHNWKETTPILKKLLEETGLFAVDVATSPPKGKDMSGFRPDFAAYKLVVLNYQGDDWPEATQKAFVDYVAQGGGVVCYHFAAAAFPKWKEYNRIIGVGGWGDRNEKAGPYLCWRDGRIVRATDPPGKAGFHGPQQTFQIVVREPEHPITRGTAQGVHAIGRRALLPAPRAGRERHRAGHCLRTEAERRHGRERADADDDHLRPRAGLLDPLGPRRPTVEERGLHRHVPAGAEWAATGNVTQKVPADFPGPDRPSIRQGVRCRRSVGRLRRL